ncbi:MAG: hypothetical protein H0X16_09665 [Chloroflexi bacterium]|nr:hypothetical protein [Chloroflexota bacterium]
MRMRTTAAALFALAAISAFADPAPTLASCGVSFDDEPGVVVFAGTVDEVDPARAGTARMLVDQWFAGDRPTDSVVVTGAVASNDLGVVSSVDWTPRAGENYLIVGRWDSSGALVSHPCQQMPVTARKLDEARAVFGEPLEAPFASPRSTDDPNAGGEPVSPTAQPDPGRAGGKTGTMPPLGPILAGVVLGAVALATLVAWGRRRARDS